MAARFHYVGGLPFRGVPFRGPIRIPIYIMIMKYYTYPAR